MYALALTGVKWFGPITPFGGVMFILGWIWFSYAAWKSQ
ncbi:membrane protein [Vibrio cholerae]|nr:membrane protein [Vibrio cholerae]CSD67382.1 membrane protein [Vibrio cholerae]